MSAEDGRNASTPSPPPTAHRRRWLRRSGWLALGLTLVLGVLVIDLWRALGQKPAGERKAQLASSPQWTGDRFNNPLPTVEPELWPVLKAMLGGDEVRNPADPLPLQALNASSFDEPPASGLRLSWLGHSTFIIEIDGKRVLTDPVWGERASPSSFVGPKRWHDPPLAIDELPPLDAIIISHDHYDHLDYPAVAALRDNPVRWYVPLGIGSHLEYWGVPAERIHEHDWWDEIEIDDLKLVMTPSRHFSGRAPGAANSTLWCSWSIIGPTHRVFFSGDSAMFPGYAEIGERLGPFDVTLMENGAYNALWRDVHLGPEQAMEAHKLVRGKLFVPIHWGTFNLATHAWTEPAERIIVAAEQAGVDLVIPRPGQQFEPANPPPLERWWPEVPWQTAEQAPVISTNLDHPEGAALWAPGARRETTP